MPLCDNNRKLFLHYLFSTKNDEKTTQHIICAHDHNLITVASKMEALINITRYHSCPVRNSTCLHLQLPNNICCNACKEYYLLVTTDPQHPRGTSKHTRCERPWDECFKTHRLATKCDRYKNSWKIIEDTRGEGERISNISFMGDCSINLLEDNDIKLPPRDADATAVNIQDEESQDYTPVSFVRQIATAVASPLCALIPSRTRKYNLGHRDIVLPNNQVVQNVPKNFDLISKNELSRLQGIAEKYKKLEKDAIGSKKCTWNDRARAYLATGIAQVPYASFYALEQFIPCVITGLFAAAQIPIEFKDVTRSCPSEKNLSEITIDGAVNCLLWVQMKIKGASAVFLSCDKGHRKGVDHFAKMISWSDFVEDRVCSFCLDIDGVRNNGCNERMIWDFDVSIIFRSV